MYIIYTACVFVFVCVCVCVCICVCVCVCMYVYMYTCKYICLSPLCSTKAFFPPPQAHAPSCILPQCVSSLSSACGTGTHKHRAHHSLANIKLQTPSKITNSTEYRRASRSRKRAPSRRVLSDSTSAISAFPELLHEVVPVQPVWHLRDADADAECGDGNRW